MLQLINELFAIAPTAVPLSGIDIRPKIRFTK